MVYDIQVCWQLASKLSANLYNLYLLLCVQWKTPDDVQENCPKQVEFYYINKFENLVHLVGFIIRIYHGARSSERQTWEIYRIYILTFSILHSPSWEANWFVASQEIPRISRNPKVHYRTHKRPTTVSIRGQPNPVHIPTSDLLKFHQNIIHPSTPRSPQCSPIILPYLNSLVLIQFTFHYKAKQNFHIIYITPW